MNSPTWIVTLALLLPAATLAQDARSYQCTFGDNVRRVEIMSEPGVSVPCEVHYYKDTEAPGERQVLWSAQSEEGYCEAQTEAFIAKLTEWGWSCQAGDPAMPAPPSDLSEDEMLGDEPAEPMAPELDDE